MGHEQPLGVQTSDELAAAIEAVTAEEGQPPEKIDELNREVFDELSGGLVRGRHAEEAMLDPDDFTTLRFKDCPEFHIAAKRVQAGRTFVLVALGAESNGATVIQAAYRLHGDDAEIARLSADASLAFRTLLERFGNRFETEGREVLFVPVLSVAATGDVQQVIGAALNLDMSHASHWGAHVAVRRTGDRMELTWPFVIDLARCKAAARGQG